MNKTEPGSNQFSRSKYQLQETTGQRNMVNNSMWIKSATFFRCRKFHKTNNLTSTEKFQGKNKGGGGGA